MVSVILTLDSVGPWRKDVFKIHSSVEGSVFICHAKVDIPFRKTLERLQTQEVCATFEHGVWTCLEQ